MLTLLYNDLIDSFTWPTYFCIFNHTFVNSQSLDMYLNVWNANIFTVKMVSKQLTGKS